MKCKYYLLFAMIVCTFLTIVQGAYSCSVPVFRYALERWKPDPYKGIFLYRGEITEEDKVLLRRLKDAAVHDEAPLNLIVREVNADTFDNEKLSSLFQGRIPDGLPRLVIWYPDQMGKKPPFLQEKMTPSLLERMRQSPKRRQLAESLIRGASVVWVYIPSGNTEKDESALDLIRSELDSALALYAKAPFTVLSGSERKQLSYGFPIVTLSRDEPAERVFTETLMRSESDLYEHTDEPMVFPVFGRGRVLGCLFGEYITAQKIREATAFLSGACSCEVKELNPGVDLLVAAPWDLVVMNSFIDEEPLPDLTGVMPARCEIGGDENREAESVDPPEENSSVFKIYAVSLGGVFLVVVLLSIIIGGKLRSK